MGMFLGKISVETPKYTVLQEGIKYAIREYPPCIAAEVSYDPSSVRGGRDGGFMILAKYIGAFGSPANTKAAPGAADDVGGEKEEKSGAEKIAMTAPVITTSSEAEPIAMTAPVVTKEEIRAVSANGESEEEEKGVEGEEEKKLLTTMQFILPAKYTMATVPKPTDERVRLREVPGRIMAAITFSGVATESHTLKKLGALRTALQEEASGYRVTGDDHMLARYNDPFTPWFLRTNEVLVPVEKVD